MNTHPHQEKTSVPLSTARSPEPSAADLTAAANGNLRAAEEAEPNAAAA
jgi:hypothetical protein